MPVETFGSISELNPAYPVTSDGLAQADDHIRGIKAAIQASFPNIDAPVQASGEELDAASAVVTNGTAKLADAGAKFKTNTRDGFENPSAGTVRVTATDNSAVKQTIVDFTGSDKKASFKGPVEATKFSGPGTVPIGGTLIWWDDTLPSDTGWAWVNGQVIANADTVCPVLLARWGSRFGGNGITTMGLPNLKEAVPVGKSTMGATTARGVITNFVSDVLTTINGIFGAATHALSASEGPQHDHEVYTKETGHTHSIPGGQGSISINTGGGAPAGVASTSSGTSGSSTTGVQLWSGPSGTGNQNKVASSGSGTAHNNVQPSVICNWIIRLG